MSLHPRFLAHALIAGLVPTLASAGELCEGTTVFEQAPDFQNALWSQEDPCVQDFIRTADDFVADGFPVSGFRWWGVYQHPPGHTPQPPDAFAVEIYESTPQNTPGNLLAASLVQNYEEVRDPENNGFTSAAYCAYLDQFFDTVENESYFVSITPILCNPEQWSWITSQDGAEPAFVLAPSQGYEDWTPVLEVYGDPLNCSFEVCQPLALVDITLTPMPWLPEYKNKVTYNSKIYWRDPITGMCIFPGPPKFITFSLLGESSERGYCLNSGILAHTDLHLNTIENHAPFTPVAWTAGICDAFGDHDHWTAVKTKSCVVEATVTVYSEDYGSWGLIEASAGGCNAVPVDNLLPREPGGATSCTIGPSTSFIPRDNNGNHIADAWAGDATHGNHIPEWDEEEQPNPQSFRKGDGFTRYEEYRGLETRGADNTTPHRRLSTLVKEIGVYRQSVAWTTEDLSFSADVLDLLPDQMNGAFHDDENGGQGTRNPSRGPRTVNLNRTSHTTVDQHGLWLAVGGTGTERGHWGRTHDEDGDPAPAWTVSPQSVGRIDVYSETIRDDAKLRKSHGQRWIRGGKRINIGTWKSDGTGREDEIIKDIIGHELGHGHGHRHHLNKKRWTGLRPPISATIYFDVTAGARPLPREEQSTTNTEKLATCVLHYNYDEIRESLRLIGHSYGGKTTYNTYDPTWSKITTRAHGYGLTCFSRTGHPCAKNSKVRDIP